MNEVILRLVKLFEKSLETDAKKFNELKSQVDLQQLKFQSELAAINQELKLSDEVSIAIETLFDRLGNSTEAIDMDANLLAE